MAQTYVRKFDRYCTDIPMLLLYAVSWFVAAYIFYIALARGADPNRLTRGVDYLDRVCGISEGVENQPFAAWPWVLPPFPEDFDVADLFDVKVCLSSCEETQTSTLLVDRYESIEALSFCVPQFNTTEAAQLFEREELQELTNFAATLSRSLSDIEFVFPAFIFSGFAAALLSLIYIWSAQRFAKVLVLGSITAVVASGFILSLYIYTYSKFVLTEESTRQSVYRWTSIIVGSICAIIALIIIILRQRIYIAIEVVRETSKAVYDVSTVFLLPFALSFFTGLYIVFWSYGALFLFSVQVVKEPQTLPAELQATLGVTEFVDREFDTSLRNAVIYYIFHFFWTTQFVIYFGYMTLSGTIADWYFTRYDAPGVKRRGEEEDELPPNALKDSIFRTIRYHLGTIAFGSLIIAFIKTLRAIIMSFYNSTRGQQNQLQQALFVVAERLLKCLQCVIDVVNKNAFVYCSISGDAFCPSACTSFQLIWANLGRISALVLVSEFLVFVGKFTVSITITGVAALAFENLEYYQENVNTILFPCACIFLISYTVSHFFMTVYETCIDAIFLCFLMDLEGNKNGALFASEELLRIVGKYEAQSKELANTLKGEELEEMRIRSNTVGAVTIE
jgi:hypothetical protein